MWGGGIFLTHTVLVNIIVSFDNDLYSEYFDV